MKIINKYLRLICAYIVSIIEMPPASILGLFSWNGNWTHIANRCVAKTIIRLLCSKTNIKGIENIDKKKTYILASNHQSLLDIVILLSVIPLQFRFIAKISLLFVPLVGFNILASRHILINRKRKFSAYKSLQKAIEALKNGKSILIFPEGTRTQTDEVKPFKRGSLMLALNSKKPILPITLNDTRKLFQKGNKYTGPGEITITIEKPISTEKITKNNQNKYLQKLYTTINNNYKIPPKK